jgi:hypothetical protein
MPHDPLTPPIQSIDDDDEAMDTLDEPIVQNPPYPRISLIRPLGLAVYGLPKIDPFRRENR